MSDMNVLRNYNRKVCMLGVFFACFCVSIVNGQTVSTVDVSGVDLGNKNYVTTTSFAGSNGIAWTANRDLWVSKIFYATTEIYAIPYQNSLNMLAIPNSNSNDENNRVLLTSSWLQDIKSITFLIARTKAYDDRNRVHIDVARCEPDYVLKNEDWENAYVVNAIENYIDATIANAMAAEGYRESQYDRVTHEFSTPYSGYIRLRIESTYTPSPNTKCPYLLIPELTVVHNAPVPCTSCFSVTIR